MKNLSNLLVTLIFAIFIMSCGQQKPVKTIENLKAAYNGESTASAKYAKFAEKARSEGFENIAKMFEATSKAENIHADNHRKALEKLDEKVGAPVLGSFEVKTTKENLADAIKGESYEIDTMYPDFIKAADADKSDQAKKSFTWAMDTEKKHKDFYQKALDSIIAGTDKALPGKWYICTVCGNTYDEPSIKEACDFCGTKKDKFISF